MRNRFALPAVGAAAALVLTACGAAPEAKTDASAAASAASGEGKVLACMISDSGGFDDKSFNESGKAGLDKAKADLGVDVKLYQSSANADFDRNATQAVKDGCTLIFGVGFLLKETITKAAKANPNVHFALIDSTFDEPIANAKALVFNTAEAGFLAGYAAAGMSKTGKVGTFLGMQLPTTAIFADGFADGVAQYNKDNGKNVELLGWDKEGQKGQATGDFEDIQKGKQTAEALFNQGADVVMPVAGPVGKGALSAAKDKPEERMVVWVDADGALTNAADSNVILTSVMKQIGAAVFDTVKESKEGKFSADAYVGTLANGGVALAPFHDFDSKVPADLKAKLTELQDQIAKGELKVESKNSPK